MRDRTSPSTVAEACSVWVRDPWQHHRIHTELQRLEIALDDSIDWLGGSVVVHQ